MKKVLSIAASVLMFAGVAFSATDTETGTITDIIIGPSFSLTLASWTQDGAAAGKPTVGLARTNGNLVFTAMDMTSAGITADPDAVGAEAYKVTPHRANAYFNNVQFWMANNVYPAFRADVTGSGTLFALAAPLAGESVMHVIPMSATYEIGVAPNVQTKTTARPEFIVNSGDPIALINNTATTLYHDNNAIIDGDDVFAAIFTIDFMPVTIPSGTYSGTMQYDLISE